MLVIDDGIDATPLCRTEHERFFVEAVLLHCRQKWREAPDEPTKMTNDQVKEIMRGRHEVKLDSTQFSRLKRKYVTSLPTDPNGKVRSASRFELLRELVKGRIGVPSEYELSGLRPFIDTGADTAEGVSCGST